MKSQGIPVLASISKNENYIIFKPELDENQEKFILTILSKFNDIIEIESYDKKAA